MPHAQRLASGEKSRYVQVGSLSASNPDILEAGRRDFQYLSVKSTYGEPKSSNEQSNLSTTESTIPPLSSQMPSSEHDNSDRDFVLKLAEAGYYHTEALEHVLDDQQDQDELLDLEQLEALRQQPTAAAFAETTGTDTTVEQILPWSHRTRTRDDIDALELQKEALDLALSDECSQLSRDGKQVLFPDDTAAPGDWRPVSGTSDVARQRARQAIFSRRNRYCLGDVPGAYAVPGTATRTRRRSSGGLVSIPMPVGRGKWHALDDSDHYDPISTLSLNVEALRDASRGAEEEDSLPRTNGTELCNRVPCPPQKQHSSLKECYKNSRWCWCALTAGMVVAVVVIALTVGVFLGAGGRGTPQKPSINDGVNTTESGPSDSFGKLLLHCSTSSETLTNDLLQPFLHLNRTVYLPYVELISDFDFPLDSCRPENLALLYLTMIEEKKDTKVFEWNNVTKNTYLLMMLFVSWDGMRWENNTGWQTFVSYCVWYGVECNNQEEVVSLYLQGNGAKGTIPTVLGLLTELQTLQLDGRIQGAFSTTVLNGPSRRGPLSGGIPSEMFRLTNLKVLSLTDNDLTGSLPTDLGTLTALEALSFGYNKFSGPVPWSTMVDLQKLEYLYLDSNYMSGSLPGVLGHMTNLHTISMVDNRLSGTIPPFLFQELQVTLNNIDLQGNRFSGTIPSEVGLCSMLTTLLLANNLLEGTVPTEIGKLYNLQVLSAYKTNLEGSVPGEICLLRTIGSLVALEANCVEDTQGILQCSVPDCCTSNPYECNNHS
jgi:hypothetical protein